MPSVFLSVVFAAALAASPQDTRPTDDRSAPVAVPEPSAEAMAYYRGGNVFWIVREVLALAVPALVLFSGLSIRMRDLAQRTGRWWFLVVVVYFALYWLLNGLLHLPLDYYSGFVRQHDYGLSHQSFLALASRRVLDWSVTLVFGRWWSGFPTG